MKERCKKPTLNIINGNWTFVISLCLAILFGVTFLFAITFLFDWLISLKVYLSILILFIVIILNDKNDIKGG